jgi:homoserine kinase
MQKIKVFAPASIGNLGPGFDVLGMAISNYGDIIEAEKINEGVIIEEIIGNYELSKDSNKNTAGIAAIEVLKLLYKKYNIKGGVKLKLFKNLPCGSGLGSSAASAVAAGYAVNLLYDNLLTKDELIFPITKAEERVSGSFFCDNTAASLLGGIVLTKSYEPLEVLKLKTLKNINIVIVKPDFELLTQKAREVIPKDIPLKNAIRNTANCCGIIVGLFTNNFDLFAKSIDDRLIEQYRANLIPGFYEVKNTALKNGALGCSISGAGPAIFAICKNKLIANNVGKLMQDEFLKIGYKSNLYISKVDINGAKIID